jgi:hypothetical protein
MSGDGANEEELIYADGGWEDALLDPPTEWELTEWTEPEIDPFGD